MSSAAGDVIPQPFLRRAGTTALDVPLTSITEVKVV